MATNMMKFVIKDNQEIEMDEEVAKQNDIISNMLEVCCELIDYIYCMILEINVLGYLYHIILCYYYIMGSYGCWVSEWLGGLTGMCPPQGLILGLGNRVPE